MKVMLAVGLVLLVAACDRATAPKPFTLGPGCWTTESGTSAVKPDGSGKNAGTATTTIKRHFAVCPDSLPAGRTLDHWDTAFVDH